MHIVVRYCDFKVKENPQEMPAKSEEKNSKGVSQGNEWRTIPFQKKSAQQKVKSQHFHAGSGIIKQQTPIISVKEYSAAAGKFLEPHSPTLLAPAVNLSGKVPNKGKQKENDSFSLLGLHSQGHLDTGSITSLVTHIWALASRPNEMPILIDGSKHPDPYWASGKFSQKLLKGPKTKRE